MQKNTFTQHNIKPNIRNLTDFDTFFKSSSLDGISCCWTLGQYDIFPEDVKHKYFVFYLDSRFMRDSHKYLVLLKSATRNCKTLTLKVPSNWIPNIIGQGGYCIREIAREVGVTYINVESC